MVQLSIQNLLTWQTLFEVRFVFSATDSIIVYYVPRRIMRVITRRAKMLAGDRSQGVAEAKPRQSQDESIGFANSINLIVNSLNCFTWPTGPFFVSIYTSFSIARYSFLNCTQRNLQYFSDVLV